VTALHALLRRLVDVKAEEVGALLWSFAYFFCLLCGYYILRPVREEMGVAGGVKNLPWLFTGTFVAMLAAVPLFSAAVSRWPRRRFIPIVYRFFTLNILVFFFLLRDDALRVATGRAFFIWISVFNLFVVSVFWGFMADLWRSDQGKRLFGFVAAGGSAGAIAGPVLTASLVKIVGVANLLILSAVLLELAAQCAGRLVRLAPQVRPADREEHGRFGDERVGHGLWSGLRPVVGSRYLLGISGHTLLTTTTATVLYFQQMHVVGEAIADPARRTALFAQIDLIVNVLTILAQVLLTGRILKRAGLAWALAAVPVVSAAGFLGLAAMPVVWLIVAFQGVRRAAHYAIERPGREVLFTVVRPEEKYTSKSFIDAVVYRGGDAASGWAYSALAPAIGAVAMSLSMLPLTAAWLLLNASLARQQAARARAAEGGLTKALPVRAAP
jgi:AAA family ATP:ADP antiporter